MPTGSLAVLYRTNAQSRVLEEALRRQGIDYRLVGGFSFYARAEIRDALAYARLASNPRDVSGVPAHHQHSGARNRRDHARRARGNRTRSRN